MTYSIIFLSVPFNVVSWSVFAVAVLLVGFRGLLAYRRSGNLITMLNSLYGVTLGFDLVSYYGLVWLTHDPVILRQAALVGSVFAALSLIVQSRLCWEIFLRYRISYKPVLVTVLVLLGISLGLDWRDLTVSLNPTLYSFHTDLVSSVIKGVLLGSTLVPLGLYLAHSFVTAIDRRPKTLALGICYALAGGTTAINSLVYHSYDSPNYLIVDSGIAVFVFIWIVLPLVYKPRTPDGKR